MTTLGNVSPENVDARRQYGVMHMAQGRRDGLTSSSGI